MKQYKQACFRVGGSETLCPRDFPRHLEQRQPVDPAAEHAFDKQLNTAIAERNRQE